MEIRYPFLVKKFPYETGKETWRERYLRKLHFIGKLKEEYNIPYFPIRNFDPERFYKVNEKSKDIYNYALIYATIAKDNKFVNYLIGEKGANKFPTDLAGRVGNLEAVELFLGLNSDLAAGALEEAALAGHLDIVDYVIQNVDIGDLENPLMAAAKGGHLNIVKYLLKMGARNLNLGIAYAATGKHRDVIKYLLKKGGNIDIAIDELNILHGDKEMILFLEEFKN